MSSRRPLSGSVAAADRGCGEQPEAAGGLFEGGRARLDAGEELGAFQSGEDAGGQVPRLAVQQAGAGESGGDEVLPILERLGGRGAQDR